ncbi:MAG: hypothetical protein IPM56_17440 [Ignavibacteriales bacterium]|nr:MAG: hypothetical protein IPM56_17440 [Ignavibacteriales bacterium]
MKSISAILFFISLILFSSCGNSDDLGAKIAGKWNMKKVEELSKDVTAIHNPDNNRWIRFINDAGDKNRGTFESGSGDVKENSGKWYYYEKDNELFIDSDAGEDDDSYWEVLIKDNTMYWKGRRFEFNKRFEIFYHRDN